MDCGQRQVHLRYSHKSNRRYEKRAVYNQTETHAIQFHGWTVGLTQQHQFKCSSSCPPQLEQIWHLLPLLSSWALLAPCPGALLPWEHKAQSICPSTQCCKVLYSFSCWSFEPRCRLSWGMTFVSCHIAAKNNTGYNLFLHLLCYLTFLK